MAGVFKADARPHSSGRNDRESDPFDSNDSSDHEEKLFQELFSKYRRVV
jgi:hypothetical protein